MKNKLSTFASAAITILLISMVGVAFAPVSFPHPANTVWIDDAPFVFFTATTSVGYQFNVTVALNVTDGAVPNFFSWQAYFDYPSWVTPIAEGFTGPGGTTSEWFAGHGTIPIGPMVGGVSPFPMEAGESLKGSDVAVAKAATLFWTTFQINTAPAKGKTLLGSFSLTSESANVIVLEGDGSTQLPVNLVDDSANYTWSPPTAVPYMGIEAANYAPAGLSGLANLEYSSAVSATGDTFDMKLYVKNIDPNWYLNNITFTLTWNNSVIDTVGGLANVTVDPAWTGVVQSDAGGVYSFFGVYTGTAPPLSPSNKVLVATLHFTVVVVQALSPPATAGYFDSSTLVFSGVSFFDHTLPIGAGTPDSGLVKVDAYIVLKLPWLQVDFLNGATVGPGPVIGSTVYVGVDVVNLTQNWHTVAIQFRLNYDPTVLTLVSVTEGPFLTNPTWDLYGTWTYNQNNPGGDFTYPQPHVIFADLLFPNTTNGIYDQPVFPNAPQTPNPETPGVNATVAIFGFQVLQQNCFDGANITTALNIFPFWPPTDDNFVDKDGNYIADQPAVNGTLTILGLNEVNQQIDLVGGAVNDGYGVLPAVWPFPYPYVEGGTVPTYPAFPAPYGGQGPNAPMDIVFPQSQVFLDAYVTYNYWPVQSKDVGFEIEGPFMKLANGTLVPAPAYQVWAKLTATSDVNGVASLTYRMPWPCLDPDSITGVWKITATVTIGDTIVNDTMNFYYQRLVYITSVSTDSYSYVHGQCMKITVNYQTHSQEMYPALFAIVASDNMSVPFGFTTYGTMVGGTVFCTWINSTFTVTICIPKWAYAGNGSIQVSVYDKDPTIGGEALAPEYTPEPIFNLYPY